MPNYFSEPDILAGNRGRGDTVFDPWGLGRSADISQLLGPGPAYAPPGITGGYSPGGGGPTVETPTWNSPSSGPLPTIGTSPFGGPAITQLPTTWRNIPGLGWVPHGIGVDPGGGGGQPDPGSWTQGPASGPGDNKSGGGPPPAGGGIPLIKTPPEYNG